MRICRIEKNAITLLGPIRLRFEQGPCLVGIFTSSSVTDVMRSCSSSGSRLSKLCVSALENWWSRVTVQLVC